jgi:hypothetical protein
MAWWKKACLTLGLFVVWFFGLIVVGGRGYPSQYFWVSGGAAPIGFAVAPFWKFRASVWYWPTVAMLAAANLVMMYFARIDLGHRDLPAKGFLQLLFLADCMIAGEQWFAFAGYFVDSFRGSYPIHDRPMVQRLTLTKRSLNRSSAPGATVARQLSGSEPASRLSGPAFAVRRAERRKVVVS